MNIDLEGTTLSPRNCRGSSLRPRQAKVGTEEFAYRRAGKWNLRGLTPGHRHMGRMALPGGSRPVGAAAPGVQGPSNLTVASLR
jgi:hypothetical protein